MGAAIVISKRVCPTHFIQTSNDAHEKINRHASDIDRISRQQRVTLVSMSGLRVVGASLLELGLSLPGIARRSQALSELPPLGLLTLAATVPKGWNVSLLSDDGANAEQDVFDSIMATLPDVIAFSALTPAVDRAARLSDRIRHRL